MGNTGWTKKEKNFPGKEVSLSKGLGAGESRMPGGSERGRVIGRTRRATSGQMAGPRALQGTGVSAEKGNVQVCMFSRPCCFIPLEEKMKNFVPLVGCKFPFPKAKNFLEPEGWTHLLSFKCLFFSRECHNPASGPNSAPQRSLPLCHISEPRFSHLSNRAKVFQSPGEADKSCVQTRFPWEPAVCQAQ